MKGILSLTVCLLLASRAFGLHAVRSDYAENKKADVWTFNETREELTASFIMEYNKLYNQCYIRTDTAFIAKLRGYVAEDNHYVNSAGRPLMKILFRMESFTYHEEKVSPDTRKLISYVTEPYIMVLLERAIKEEMVNDNTLVPDTTYMFTDKIIKEVSRQLHLMMTNKLPYYTYETKQRQVIKFVSLRTGNDLFSPTQDNLDRDYTGSLLLEIGTDYLNILRKRPLKTYQTLLYGFDVYTPSFRDSTKFKAFNSYDTFDRPHASFQYLGWSKKCLQKYNRFRWSYTLKFGKIGGKIGAQFQTALHQDISYSRRPRGWDAQISNGGRLGLSLETRSEYQIYLNHMPSRPNNFGNFYLTPFVDLKLGTYMTNAGLGLHVTNKNFRQNNHNFINHRTRQGANHVTDHFMYMFSFKTTYVVHNTMLEGYGIINTTESKNDPYTPPSIYTLRYNQVNRWVHTGNVCFSYTTRYATFFYNWYIYSPETNLGSLHTIDPELKDINLNKRWHSIAEVGIVVNIH